MNKTVRVISFVLSILMILSVVGCGKSPEKAAKKAVKDMFSMMQSGEFDDTNSTFLLDIDEELISKDTVSLLFKNLEYKITGTTVVDEENIDVMVLVTNTNMAPVFKDYLTQLAAYFFANSSEVEKMTEEERQQKSNDVLKECLEKEDLETITNEVEIRVTLTDGKWVVDPDDTAMNAIFGGLMDVLQDLDKE